MTIGGHSNLARRVRRWLGRIGAVHRGVLVSLAAPVVDATVLLAFNFTATQQKTEQPLPRLYPRLDAQFDCAISDMLGPAIVGGNRVRLLRNGDEILRAMFAAVRSAQRSITFEAFARPFITAMHWGIGWGFTPLPMLHIVIGRRRAVGASTESSGERPQPLSIVVAPESHRTA